MDLLRPHRGGRRPHLRCHGRGVRGGQSHLHGAGLLLTIRAGVIGWPVAHSRSPAIHLAAARALGIDLSYDAIDVRPGDATAALDAMVDEGMRGLSVTMPHKEAVIERLDHISSTAYQLRAVNCVVNDDGVLSGINTDGEGFLRGVSHRLGVSMEGRSVVMVGAGGAARAIVQAMGEAGASSIRILNRNVQRAELAASLADQAAVGSAEDLERADIVVNATSLGMAGTSGEHRMPLVVEQLHEAAIVVDIVYNPVETDLLRAARERGLIALGGLPMLAGQAAAQFVRWTGLEPSLDVMMEAALADG